MKREGRLRWNYINPTPIKELYDTWIGGYADGAVDSSLHGTRNRRTLIVASPNGPRFAMSGFACSPKSTCTSGCSFVSRFRSSGSFQDLPGFDSLFGVGIPSASLEIGVTRTCSVYHRSWGMNSRPSDSNCYYYSPYDQGKGNENCSAEKRQVSPYKRDDSSRRERRRGSGG